MKRWRTFLTAVIVAGALGWLLSPAYRPVTADLDLSHKTTTPAIRAGGDIVPSVRWPEVMDLYDRAGALTLAISLPQRDAYLWHLRLACQSAGHHVTIRLNGTPRQELVSTKAGAAEKFRMRTAPSEILVGDNTIEFRHAGPPRSVRYERVIAKNYQAVIITHAAYLVLRTSTAAPRIGLLWWLVWAVAGGLLVHAASGIGARALGGLYRQALPRADGWLAIPMAIIGCLALAGIGLEFVSPYRLVLSPAAGGILLISPVVAFVFLLAIPGLLWRAIRGIYGVIAGAQLPKRLLDAQRSFLSALRAAPRAAGRVAGHAAGRAAPRAALCAAILAALGSTLLAVGRLILIALRDLLVWFVARALPATGRWLWRQWRRHQHAAGYFQFFLYLLVLSGLLWVLGVKPLAERMSEWAWCTLLISALLYAVRALKTEDREGTS